MPHPDKQQIIELVNQLLTRSGLGIDQAVARMQAHGCDITRHSFENQFTTRAGRKPNVSPEWVPALIAAFTERLSNGERCTAAEAVELARLTRLPIDAVGKLKQFFPTAEFITAYKQYAPPLDLPHDESEPLDSRCPYRGLQPFDEAHAEFFFGREADVEWLLTALQHSRFLAVIGPSGSGKSSLVRAGLIPALRCQTCDIRLFTPGQDPLAALLGAVSGDARRHNRPALSQELKADDHALHRLALEILAGRPDEAQLILMADQFEELFTLCQDEAVRQTFIANLIQAAAQPESRTLVILTMRADFYPQAAAYPELAVYLADNQVLLSQMTETELTQAITRPAQRVGLHFEEGLVDRLLHDAAAEPGALPLLQHALLELWERRHGRELTLAAYQSIGGVHGALARRADTLLAEFSPEQQAIVRRVMLRLTRLGQNTADTRRRATLSELARSPEEIEAVRQVVIRLADARLLTTSFNRETGEEIVDVAHEALIRGWPTLRAWLTEDREVLHLHQQLAESAGRWAQHNREESFLYRGARLAAAEEWAETRAADMNDLERQFLTAGLAARDQVVANRVRQQRRAVRNLAMGLTAALVALVIAVGLAVLAFNQRQQVESERQATLSRQLAAQAQENVAGQYDLALLLSAEAYDIADTFEARDSLLTALSISPHVDTFLREHTDWVWSVAFSPDGQTLASGSADGTIILWDTKTGGPIGKPLTGHSGWVRSVAFSPDGQILASGGDDGTIRLWHPATGQAINAPLTGHAGFITNLAFSPDGQILASGSADGAIILWDTKTGEPIGKPLTDHTGFVLSVAFSPDGKTLASGSEDETIILRDVSARLNPSISQHGQQTDEQPLAHALPHHQAAVSTVTFSPDGQTLASGGADGTIILWDVESRQPRREPLTGHKSGVTSLAFSSDGQLLISGSEDQTLIAWDSGGRPQGEPMIGHSDSVLSVAISPESTTSRLAASGSADGTIILWQPDALHPMAELLTGAADVVRDVAFSPDGRILAASNADTTITLWDMSNAKALATRQPVASPLTGHEGIVDDVAFSPDGKILASGSDDRTIILWDVANRQPLIPPLITEHPGPILDLAFGPDSKTLVSNDEDGKTIVWNIPVLLNTNTLTQPSANLTLPHIGKAVSLSPDGELLVTSDISHTLVLWDIADANPQQPVSSRLFGHTDDVVTTAFSPNGQLLASGGRDDAVILWNVPAALDLLQNREQPDLPARFPLLGHTGDIESVTFSPDGQLLASGSDNERVILWDVAVRQPLGLPLLSGGQARSVAFSPDGQTLASAGRNDGAIVLWNINPESWRDKVCDIVGRNLTPTEWQRYLGNEPYRLTCPEAPQPEPDSQSNLSLPAPTPTVDLSNILVKDPVPIIEAFDSDQGFIQTSDNVYIEDGQVIWHFKRDGGLQYVYRSIPPFRGNVRLTVQGQVASWTNNCLIQAGVGNKLGKGITVNFGWTGGGCPTNGPLVLAEGVQLDNHESSCNFTGNWLWIEAGKPYTATLDIVNETASLAVDGVGQSAGEVRYDGPYTILWVGNNGRGDWPECTGTIDTVMVGPLD